MIMTMIAANLQQVRSRISLACASAGRPEESVRLLAVSKTFGADDTTVHVLRRGGEPPVEIGPASKRVVSDGIWDVIADSLHA